MEKGRNGQKSKKKSVETADLTIIYLYRDFSIKEYLDQKVEKIEKIKLTPSWPQVDRIFERILEILKENNKIAKSTLRWKL